MKGLIGMEPLPCFELIEAYCNYAMICSYLRLSQRVVIFLPMVQDLVWSCTLGTANVQGNTTPV